MKRVGEGRAESYEHECIVYAKFRRRFSPHVKQNTWGNQIVVDYSESPHD